MTDTCSKTRTFLSQTVGRKTLAQQCAVVFSCPPPSVKEILV
ncbi:MAG: hypothetical protein KatS3mg031_1650 [Chitinophagales bacterium]|nr:MAG: hypothetical protein KatS3mg031_1650 [Chitinophagales bacterium]